MVELKKVTESPDIERIKATANSAKEFEMDPKGYFLIRYIAETQEIEAGYCKLNKINFILKKIVGKNAEEVYNTIIREGLVSSDLHAAYLGKELEKAEIAMKLGIDYVQDSPLNFENLRKTV